MIGTRLKRGRNGATLINMAVNLQHQRFRPVPIYDQRSIDGRQLGSSELHIEPHIDDRTAHGDHRALRSL